MKICNFLCVSVLAQSKYDAPSRSTLTSLEMEANGHDPELLKFVKQRNREQNLLLEQRREKRKFLEQQARFG